MVAPKGATQEDFKKLGKGILNAASAVKDKVTLGGLVHTGLNPLDTVNSVAKKAREAIQDRLAVVKANQKGYYEAAANSNNRPAVRAGAALGAAGSEIEEAALKLADNILDDMKGSTKGNIGGMEDLFGKRRSITYAGDEDEAKKPGPKNKAEMGPRPTSSGDAEEKAKATSLLSTAVTDEDKKKEAAGTAPTTASKPASPDEGLPTPSGP